MSSPTALALTDGRWVVPANRWDLLDGHPGRPSATVSIVIAFYEQQSELDLVLAALELQDYPRELVDVIVCDDGSRRSPDVSACSLPCSVLRQPDRGFRAAAARNMGARHSTADILCFLDADTVPEPGYVSAIARLPSLLPDALVVGRRRHADLSEWTPAQLARWWSGGCGPDVLDEPQWLVDAYAHTRDLLDIDNRSYRYIISSVMSCTRELFDYCGGFDESFDSYGGEDWEFAHRALSCGAVVHHARTAVAWHNGPDWAGRDVADRAAEKNAEALAVAHLITDPDARRHGLRYGIPHVVVEVDADDHGPGSLVQTVSGFLGQDVGVFVSGEGASRLLDALHVQDPRLRAGPAPESVRRRCRVVITLRGRPVLPAGNVSVLVARASSAGVASVEVRHRDAAVLCRASWALHREHRWTDGPLRFRDPGDGRRLGSVDSRTAEDVGLEIVDRDAPLAW